MTKKICLWFTCLVLLLSFSGCNQESVIGPEVELPVISYFHAIPSQIAVGGSSTLSWGVNVDKLASDQTLSVSLIWEDESAEVESVGDREVNPEVTTIYTLTADVNGNSVSKSFTVYVELKEE